MLNSTPTLDDARQELLSHILIQTNGALLAPVALAGKLIGGWHNQTVYKKIRHAEFPIPTIKLNRHLFCRVHDLASLLCGQATEPLASSLRYAAQKPGRGRPKKYADPAFASRSNLIAARAAKKAKQEAIATISTETRGEK